MNCQRTVGGSYGGEFWQRAVGGNYGNELGGGNGAELGENIVPFPHYLYTRLLSGPHKCYSPTNKYTVKKLQLQLGYADSDNGFQMVNETAVLEKCQGLTP